MAKNKKMAMKMYNNGTWGLIFGTFVGGVHVVWALLVASDLAQSLINWIFDLHMIRSPFIIVPFDLATAITLVIVTFVIGYILGWVLAAICNAFCEK